ncbi:MAG: HxsD-like protein [Candidatus Binatia bacterium]
MGQITFDRSLYTTDAVEAAAAAYAEYADIALEQSSDTVVAVVGAVRGHDRDTIEHSFCNLVLQETVVRMRRPATPAAPESD